jgi:hypothetical protein
LLVWKFVVLEAICFVFGHERGHAWALTVKAIPEKVVAENEETFCLVMRDRVLDRR